MKKKSGIFLCVLGVFAITVAGAKFIVQKERDLSLADSSIISFPWIISLGALLLAGGIIMISGSRRIG